MTENFENYARMFQALSDPTRLQILRILEVGERSVTEIVDFFSLSQPTISRHLGALAACGLLKARKKEQQKIYSIDSEKFREMLSGYFGKFGSLKGLKF